MRKTLLILICMIASTAIMAQTQQGYIKTKGRLGSNGQVIAGSRIPGATIQVKGRTAVVSQGNGTFSFPIPAQSFYVQSVQKQGYVLTDPDVLSRQYAYSANPLILVMEDQQQQESDRRSIERRISSNLYAELQRRNDEIEALKEQNKISEERYHELLQQLNKAQDDNEKIIKDMAERYTKMDFDQIDEFNRRISDCILNGRLTEADSLLRTKGDISERISQLNRHHEANEQARTELENSEAAEQQTRNDIAQDCYSKFEVFKMQHKNDSAAHYLELRVGLDTTNVDWLVEAGEFLQEYQANFPLAQSYFERALRHALIQYGEKSLKVGIIYDNLGCVSSIKDNYEKALEYHQKALDIMIALFGEHHPDVAKVYTNYGAAHSRIGNFSRGLELYQKAIEILCEFYSENHLQLASSYNNISQAYAGSGKYEEAMNYTRKALEIYKKSYGERHPCIAIAYINMGAYLVDQADFNNALEYYFKALDILNEFYGEHHTNIATIYNAVGNLFAFQGNYTSSLTFLQKALSIQLDIYGEKHTTTAMTYQDIGNVYSYAGDNEKSLEYNLKALEILKSLGSHFHILAQAYNNVGYLSYLLGKYAEALDYHQQALKLRQDVIGDSRDVAQSYDNIGMAYLGLGNYAQAMEAHQKALKLRKEVQGEHHPELAWSYLGIGNVHLAQGHNDEAIENFQLAYTCRKEGGLGERNPETIKCQTKLGDAYSAKGDYATALRYYEDALTKYQELLGDDHPSTKTTKERVEAIRAKAAQ